MDNNSLSHIKWTYKYHIVFAPKFRRKVIYKQILTNEKYIGDALLQKTYTVSILDKKRATNKGNLPKYYVEGSHEAIIAKDIPVSCSVVTVETSIAGSSGTTEAASQRYGDALAEV